MEPTEDAAKKVELVAAEGNAYQAALDYMKSTDVSAQTQIDDYTISVVYEKAEGMYFPDGEDKLQWQRPAPDQNLHVEVAVQDKTDKRFIPGLDITLQLFDTHQSPVGNEQAVPFLWHPFLYHYGRDWHIPGDGSYTARITVKQPQFGRHDSLIGKRYPRTVTVELGPVAVKAGQKPTGPE